MQCTACHQSDHFTKYRHTSEEWQGRIPLGGSLMRGRNRFGDAFWP